MAHEGLRHRARRVVGERQVVGNGGGRRERACARHGERMRAVNRERRTDKRDAGGHVDRHVARDGERGFSKRLGISDRDRAALEHRAARPAVALQEDQFAAAAFREDARLVGAPSRVLSVCKNAVHDQLAALLDVEHAVGIAVVEVRVARPRHVARRRARVDGHAALERRVALLAGVRLGNRAGTILEPRARHLQGSHRTVRDGGRLQMVERRPLAQLKRQVRRRTAVISEEAAHAKPEHTLLHDPTRWCRHGSDTRGEIERARPVLHERVTLGCEPSGRRRERLALRHAHDTRAADGVVFGRGNGRAERHAALGGHHNLRHARAEVGLGGDVGHETGEREDVVLHCGRACCFRLVAVRKRREGRTCRDRRHAQNSPSCNLFHSALPFRKVVNAVIIPYSDLGRKSEVAAAGVAIGTPAQERGPPDLHLNGR